MGIRTSLFQHWRPAPQGILIYTQWTTPDEELREIDMFLNIAVWQQRGY